MKWFRRPAEVLGRGVAVVLWFSIAGLFVLLRAGGRSLSPKGRAVARFAARICGPPARAILRALGRPAWSFVRIAILAIAAVGLLVDKGVDKGVRSVLATIRWCGRGLRAAAKSLVVGLRVGIRVGIGLGIGLGRRLNRMFGPAARAVGRGILAAGVTVARGIVIMARFIGPLLGPAIRAIGRIVAISARWSAMAVGRLVGRPGASLCGWLARAFRTVGRVGRDVAAKAGALVGATRVALEKLSRGLDRGTRVAFGTAQHRARSRALAGGAAAPWNTSLVDVPGATDPVGAGTTTVSVACHQNEYLAPGATVVTAIISVTAEVSVGAGGEAEAVEVILLDCSASMGYPWDKIRAARAATRAAVEGLRDGVWFAVVRGDEGAAVAYPPTAGLVQASAATKREAATAIASLQPVGGTAIGRWLRLARDLMQLRPGAIHHAILLTDGKDENETEDELDSAILACEGNFQCDCRGIGTDWAVAELRKVSSALLGSLDIIREPRQMEEDFRHMTTAAMERQMVATLQVWTPQHASVMFLRQVSPAIEDLTARARPVSAQVAEYTTGAWAAERRDYHLSVRVRPAEVSAEMLAARVALVARGRTLATGRVKAVWTDELARSALISEEVAHYTDQAELAAAIQEGLQARRENDEVTATARLGRAVQLAAQSGHEATSLLLSSVVDVDDALTGTVRLKRDVDALDEMALDTRSTKTTRTAPAM